MGQYTPGGRCVLRGLETESGLSLDGQRGTVIGIEPDVGHVTVALDNGFASTLALPFLCVRAEHKGWTDAQQMAAEFPDTFELGSLEEIRAMVVPGALAKICDNAAGERFWTKVVDVDAAGKVTAVVDNQLLFSEFDLDDDVTYELRHVYDVKQDDSDA